MTESNRPRPRPTSAPSSAPVDIPDGGVAVELPPHRPVTRSAAPTGRGRRRGVTGFLRTKRGRWTAVSVLAVLVLVAGLLFSGFLSSPADPLPDAPAAAGSGGLESLAPTLGATASTAKATGPASAEDIRRELKARAGQLNNPLNRLRSGGVHTVSVSVRSAGAVNTVGYLIPTSVNTNFAYGTRTVRASSFGVSTRAVGSGYLALVFVQAGSKDVAVTCTVRVDGRVVSTESTAGAYGRQVCLG